MAELRDELHVALKSMMAVIAAGTGNTEEGETITELLRRIDDLGAAMAEECPPMLQHYLEKRSYQKAVHFLEGEDEAEEPNC